MDFEDVCDGEAPELDIQIIEAIAALFSSLDFSEGSISSDIIQTVVNSITLKAITLDEPALGEFSRCKLMNMDTWKDWIAGKQEQLNQFHDLQIFGEAILCPTQKRLLCYVHIENIMSSEMDNVVSANAVMDL